MDSTAKKMFAIAAVIIVIAVAVMAVVAVSNKNPDPSGDTVIDVRGRKVTVPGEVNRVVCLSAGSARLMAYFGAVDKIVGIDSSDADASSKNYFNATYRIAYPGIRDIRCIGDDSQYREIIAVNPQVIIASKASVDDLDNLQSKTGVPVVGIAAEGSITVDDEMFAKNIAIVGKVLKMEKRAGVLLDGIKAFENELRNYASKVTDKPKAYIGGMFYMMEGGLEMTTGKYIPFDFAGVANVMSDKKGGNPYQTDIKAIASSNADYMFVDSMTYNSSKDSFNRNKSTLSGLPAVSKNSIEDKRMFSLFVYKYYGTNWESELINAYFIGNVANPEIYRYDVEERMNAVLSLFYPGSGITIKEIREKQPPGAEWLDW